MSSQKDKNTLGVTDPEGKDDLRQIMETDWFETEMDAYRLAIAVAIGRGLEVSSEPLRGTETKWNVGSLDRDGQLKALMRARMPEISRPYEYSEKLADVGLRYLREGLVTTGQTLASVVNGIEASGDADEGEGGGDV